MVVAGFQGVAGAYSELAAQAYFDGKKQLEIKPFESFAKVFTFLANGRIDYGVIPIENSVAGSIHENYDLLRERNAWICGEHKLRVAHCLIGTKDSTKAQIRQVLSHPQALAQCKNYLRKSKAMRPSPFFDTAGAAQYVDQCRDPKIAAIASEFAAKKYGLKVLEKNIEDNRENYTRFLIIKSRRIHTRGLKNPKALHKTSIVFALKNIPGCLQKCLSIFAIRDIDLFKIESRPLVGKKWEYLFYLDFAGSLLMEAQQNALRHLEEITDHLEVLGSYPCDVRS